MYNLELENSGEKSEICARPHRPGPWEGSESTIFSEVFFAKKNWGTVQIIGGEYKGRRWGSSSWETLTEEDINEYHQEKDKQTNQMIASTNTERAIRKGLARLSGNGRKKSDWDLVEPIPTQEMVRLEVIFKGGLNVTISVPSLGVDSPANYDLIVRDRMKKDGYNLDKIKKIRIK